MHLMGYLEELGILDWRIREGFQKQSSKYGHLPSNIFFHLIYTYIATQKIVYLEQYLWHF